jgi:glycolate oxidase
MNPDPLDFDLTPLLVGSEGTLGIITAALLRLIDAPAAQGTMRIFFATLEAAGSSAAAIMAAGIVPSVCELMDRSVLDAVSQYTGIRLPNGAEALLLVELDGSPEEVGSGMARVENICRNRRAIQVRATQDPADAERLWRLRRSVSPSLARLSMGKLNEDVAVPRSRLPELIQAVQHLSKRYGLDIPCYGHAGDGNLHVNVMYNPGDLLQAKRARQAVEEIFKETIALGGTISGEHGIGSVKKDYMRLQMSNAELEVQRWIKESFDPEGLFNPGKVVPD